MSVAPRRLWHPLRRREVQSYKLTQEADADFAGIFEFGIDRFGLAQAEEYQLELINRFIQIAQNPSQYPRVDEIREGYRKSVYKSHTIYYHLLDEQTVLIVRILRSQQIVMPGPR